MPTNKGSGLRRSATRAVLVLALVTTFPIACRPRATGPEQRYPIKGKVVNVDKRGSVVTVAHESITGYMEAMTMPFKLKDSSLLDVMADGDRLQATLVVAGARSWLEDVVVVRESADPGATSVNSIEPKPGDEVPDFALVNQDGKRITLRQYGGRIIVVTFIYTRCPLPDYCPLMTNNFVAINRELQGKPALRDKTHLLSVTIDPDYDKPKILRDYGSRFAGSDNGEFKRWEFATGSPYSSASSSIRRSTSDSRVRGITPSCT